MIVKLVVVILIIVMLYRDGRLAITHHRPFRFALCAFWALLVCAFFSRNQTLYPIVALCLVSVLILKARERNEINRIFGGDPSKPKSATGAPSMWDREVDG